MTVELSIAGDHMPSQPGETLNMSKLSILFSRREHSHNRFYFQQSNDKSLLCSRFNVRNCDGHLWPTSVVHVAVHKNP